MKRIAFISEHASPLAVLGGTDAGGQNVYVGELARQLAEKGFLIDVFTRRENPDIPQKVKWMKGVRIIHVDAGPAIVLPKEKILPYMAAFRESMLRFMQQEGITYHLMHANFFMSALVAMELKAITHIPYVVTYHALGHIRRIHQKEQDQFPPERLNIEEQTMRAADGIVAECPQDLQDMLQYYHPDPGKITIIPCGVNPGEIYKVDKQYARGLLGLSPQDKILLQLGRMVPRKGVDNVIRAMAHLDCARAGIRLIVAGGDRDMEKQSPEMRRLHQVASDAGVTAAVTFAGQRDREELKYFYSAADLFITTPWYEPFGITPLEAMACGTPVIGANVGGIKYSVADNVTGRLVPPNDPLALAETVQELLGNPVLLSRMQTQAEARIKKHFTWEKVAVQMDKLYRQVINRHEQEAQSSILRRAV